MPHRIRAIDLKLEPLEAALLIENLEVDLGAASAVHRAGMVGLCPASREKARDDEACAGASRVRDDEEVAPDALGEMCSAGSDLQGERRPVEGGLPLLGGQPEKLREGA